MAFWKPNNPATCDNGLKLQGALDSNLQVGNKIPSLEYNRLGRNNKDGILLFIVSFIGFQLFKSL